MWKIYGYITTHTYKKFPKSVFNTDEKKKRKKMAKKEDREMGMAGKKIGGWEKTQRSVPIAVAKKNKKKKKTKIEEGIEMWVLHPPYMWDNE